MWIKDILFTHRMTSTAPDFMRTPTKDYKKIRDIAETILESASATAEQRQKANRWLGECNKATK